MKIWIVGAKGMLGSCFLKYVQGKNISFVSSNHFEADITSLSSLETFVQKHSGITHVMNCSAYTSVDCAEKEKDKAYEVNVKGVGNLAEVAFAYSMKLVHFSTDYVFSGEQKIPYQEDASCHPLNVYGKTKYEGEQKLLLKKQDSCVVRTSWLFGYGKENVISKFLHKMQQQETIFVVNDTSGRLTFCEDLVEATFSLLSETGIFHFANEGITSWYDIALYVQKKALDLKIPLRCREVVPIEKKDYACLAIRPSYSVLDTKKIEKILKKHPRHWQETVDEYMQKAFL